MPSISSPNQSAEPIADTIPDELKGNIFRGIDGFSHKYFENDALLDTIQKKTQDSRSAEILTRLTANVPKVNHAELLADWLKDFQALFFIENHSHFRLKIQPLLNSSTASGSRVTLETSDTKYTAGSTRVFGEFRYDGLDKTNTIGQFSHHALEIFKSQPVRRFLHGFVVNHNAMELWVFDRSGAYSGERIDLAQKPGLLVHILASYTLMSDNEIGFNTLVKTRSPGSDSYIEFDQENTFRLHPELVAAADHIVGPGTTCYAASTSKAERPDTVVKFAWAQEGLPTEFAMLKRVQDSNTWGVVKLLHHQELDSIAELRKGLHFPAPYVNRVFSCVATTPLGRPIQQFASLRELLEVLRDLVRALESLNVKARIIHRDVAIKNLIITEPRDLNWSKGVLIDLNAALDLDNARPVEPMVGSDGFMAIGILRGQKHTYRHDLESLFYVFLWFAIANDRVLSEADEILESSVPKTSRLWKWCSMDFGAVGRDKAADMTPEGFEGILYEFCPEFVPFKDLAKGLHALLFPIRDGKIFTGTEEDENAMTMLYDGMAAAFDRATMIAEA